MSEGLLPIIDLYLIHDRGIYGIRHSGVGRNPGSYQIPTKWDNPRSMALSATRSHLTNWIPAYAGMTSFLIFHAVFIYVKLNNMLDHPSFDRLRTNGFIQCFPKNPLASAEKSISFCGWQKTEDCKKTIVVKNNMNPKTARTFVWAAAGSMLLGTVVMSPAGSLFLYAIAALCAVAPTIFSTKGNRIAGGVLLAASLALLAVAYPEYEAEMTGYRARADKRSSEEAKPPAPLQPERGPGDKR